MCTGCGSYRPIGARSCGRLPGVHTDPTVPTRLVLSWNEFVHIYPQLCVDAWIGHIARMSGLRPLVSGRLCMESVSASTELSTDGGQLSPVGVRRVRARRVTTRSRCAHSC